MARPLRFPIDPKRTTVPRGVNIAGLEFSGSTLPGTEGTDFTQNGNADYAYAGAKGQNIIRIPVAWNRLQPTLGAALDTTYKGYVKNQLDWCAANGVKGLIDLHDYGRYYVAGVQQPLGSATGPSQADFVDVWNRIVTEWKDHAGLWGYSLMNEPHDIGGSLGAFSGTTRYDWNDGTVQGWTGDSATASNVSNKLRLASTVVAAGPAFFNFRKDDAGTKRGGVLTGNYLQAKVTLAAGAVGTWTCKLQWQTSGFAWKDADAVTYIRTDTSAIVSGLIAGVEVLVVAHFTTNPISSPNAFAIQIQANDAVAGAISADIDDFGQGDYPNITTDPSSGNLATATMYVAYNAAIAQIRTQDTTHYITVCTEPWAGLQSFFSTHGANPAPWIVDSANLTYLELHIYPDVDNSGQFTNPYYSASGRDIRYMGDLLEAVCQWAISNSFLVNGKPAIFIGEFGAPGNKDAAWLTMLNDFLQVADQYQIPTTAWAMGQWWGAGYVLALQPTQSYTKDTRIMELIAKHLGTIN